MAKSYGGYCDNGNNDDSASLPPLHGDSFDVRQRSFDLDGDVFATAGMLIRTLVALGVTGRVALYGITFAAQAAR